MNKFLSSGLVISAIISLVGCGGGGTTSSTDTDTVAPPPPESTVGIDPSGVTDYEKYLNKYYVPGDKKDLPLIKNTTFLMGSRGIVDNTYNADTNTNTVKITFSHTADSRYDDLDFNGVTYNLVSDISTNGETALKTTTYENHSLVFDNFYSADDLAIESGNGNCYFKDSNLIIKEIECALDFIATPVEMSSYAIGIKLNVEINSLEHDLATKYNIVSEFTHWKFIDWYFLNSFKSLVVYDINSGKELGKIIPQ